jgi:hypothetical protein
LANLTPEEFDIIVPVVLEKQLHVFDDRHGQDLDGSTVGQTNPSEDVTEGWNWVEEFGVIFQATFLTAHEVGLNPAEENISKFDAGNLKLAQGGKDGRGPASKRRTFQTLFVKKSDKFPEKIKVKRIHDSEI